MSLAETNNVTSCDGVHD